MRIDLGLVLAIVVEYILFLYYADTIFYRKKSKWKCYITIAIGYTAYFFICTFGVVAANIFSLIVLCFLCFICCYHVNFKNAFFQSLLLTGLSVASEGIIVFIPALGINMNELTKASSWQSMMVTIVSKLIYLTSIMIISRFFNKKANYTDAPSLSLMAIPLLTIVCIDLLVRANNNSQYIAAACIALVAINLVVFIINQGALRKESENAALREQAMKDKIDYKEYRLLKERDEELRIFRHDFKAHINALNSLISDDNQEAKSYIASMAHEESRSRYTEYTDNKILNILLSEKKSQCEMQNIDFVIEPVRSRLDFISDMDTVTLFSNLINNAIENCQKSEEKKISLSIYPFNESNIVIRLENTADQSPIIIDGQLRTNKANDRLHGIGMNSIRHTLKKYNGSLRWDYNKDNRVFTTIILICHPE